MFDRFAISIGFAATLLISALYGDEPAHGCSRVRLRVRCRVASCPYVPLDVGCRVSRSSGHETIQQVFDAYRNATEKKDWNTLFLLGTPQHQNVVLLTTIIVAAGSKDAKIHAIMEKRGVDWRKFDSDEWAYEDTERYRQKYSTTAESVGRTVRDKAGLYSEMMEYDRVKFDSYSIKVLELKDLVVAESTADGDAIIETIGRHRLLDNAGNPTSKTFLTTGSGRQSMRFNKVDGRWYLGL